MNGHLTKDDIEYYLLNREYSELYGQEKIFVDEHVGSEQEFNEMKAMLHGVGDIFREEEELTPDPAIKANLMREFEKKKPAAGYWLNGMLVAYFPKKEKFHKRPGVQLIGMAASVALMIGIFTQLNTDTTIDDQHQVVQEETIEEPTVIPVEDKTNSIDEFNIVNEKVVKEEEINISEVGNVEQDIAINEEPVREIITPEEAPTPLMEDKEADLFYNKDVVAESEEEMSDFTQADDVSNNATTTDTDASLVISGTTNATVTLDAYDGVETNSKSFDEVERKNLFSSARTTPGSLGKGAADLPVNSRSLDEDAELIDLLYTAM